MLCTSADRSSTCPPPALDLLGKTQIHRENPSLCISGFFKAASRTSWCVCDYALKMTTSTPRSDVRKRSNIADAQPLRLQPALACRHAAQCSEGNSSPHLEVDDFGLQPVGAQQGSALRSPNPGVRAPQLAAKLLVAGPMRTHEHTCNMHMDLMSQVFQFTRLGGRESLGQDRRETCDRKNTPSMMNLSNATAISQCRDSQDGAQCKIAC